MEWLAEHWAGLLAMTTTVGVLLKFLFWDRREKLAQIRHTEAMVEKLQMEVAEMRARSPAKRDPAKALVLPRITQTIRPRVTVWLHLFNAGAAAARDIRVSTRDPRTTDPSTTEILKTPFPILNSREGTKIPIGSLLPGAPIHLLVTWRHDDGTTGTHETVDDSFYR